MWKEWSEEEQLEDSYSGSRSREEEEEGGGYPTMTQVVRFSVFCHSWSGVYLLSEAIIAADCKQFVLMIIVTKIKN